MKKHEAVEVEEEAGSKEQLGYMTSPPPAVHHGRTMLSRLPEHLHSVNEVEDGEDLVRHPIVWPGQVVQVHHFTSQVSLQQGGIEKGHDGDCLSTKEITAHCACDFPSVLCCPH